MPCSIFQSETPPQSQEKVAKNVECIGGKFLPRLYEENRHKPLVKQLPRAREKASTIETMQHVGEIDPDYPACTVLLKGRIQKL